MQKFKYPFLIFGFVCALFFYFDKESRLFLERFQLYFENGDLKTLPPRFTSEQILNNARSLLIEKSAVKIKFPKIQLMPLLLLEVKYKGQDDTPKEGYWLWNSFQGELVLNLNPFKMSHGFQDGLSQKATRDEFRLIKTLSGRGSLNKEIVRKLLKLNSDDFERLLKSAEKKQLILLQGSLVKLHLQEPKIEIPEAIRLPSFALLPYQNSSILAQRFAKNEVAYALESTFGPNLKIRSQKEIYLPIFEVDVEKKDGSHVLYRFNSLTGEEMAETFWH